MVEFVVWLVLGLKSSALKNSDLNFFSRIEVDRSCARHFLVYCDFMSVHQPDSTLDEKHL